MTCGMNQSLMRWNRNWRWFQTCLTFQRVKISLNTDELNFIKQESRTKILKQLIPKWVKLPGSKFGPNISMTSKSNTISNMITKPSSSQGSRGGTGLTYIGKKITVNINKWSLENNKTDLRISRKWEGLSESIILYWFWIFFNFSYFVW